MEKLLQRLCMMIWRNIQGLTLELSRHSCSKENPTLANVLIDYFELHKFGKMKIIYMYSYTFAYVATYICQYLRFIALYHILCMHMHMCTLNMVMIMYGYAIDHIATYS